MIDDMCYMRVSGLAFHFALLHKKKHHTSCTYEPNHQEVRPNTPAGVAFHEAASRWGTALHRVNPFRQTLRHLSEWIQCDQVGDVGMIFTGYAGTQHGVLLLRGVTLLSANPDGQAICGYNVMTFRGHENGELQNRSVWPGDPLYMELQYSLLFPPGRGGWWREYRTLHGKRHTLAEYIRHAKWQLPHLRQSAALCQQCDLDMHETVQCQRLPYHEQQLPKKRLAQRRDFQNVVTKVLV